MSTTAEVYLAVLKASYDYEPQSDDEVKVTESQILFLLERTDDDWWKVKVKGASPDEEGPAGLVPAAYVEPAQLTSTVKAQYAYEAQASGELSIAEDEVLRAFGTEEDGWLLVQATDGERAGYVPANYVEEDGAAQEASAPAAVSFTGIVVPDSPPKPARPVSTYVDPADLVASSKAKSVGMPDPIQTWSLTLVDPKGKKKKGTLGIGNGALFFASESDKTPVQKWTTGAVSSWRLDENKPKHLFLTVDSSEMHFNCGSRDTAEDVLYKLKKSRRAAGLEDEELQVQAQAQVGNPPRKGVHFSEAPAIIPSPDEPEPDDDEPAEESPTRTNGHAAATVEDEEDAAVALYDFQAQGDDELSVTEGDKLWVVERDGDEWWKVRNAHGEEGVVPASYIEPTGPQRTPKQDDSAQRRAAEERAAAAEKAVRAAAEEREHKERERKEREQREDREREQRGPPPADQTRVWHDRTGQFRVEAAFLGYRNGMIRLHKVNGVVIEVPSEKMSIEDMAYIDKITHPTAGAQQRRASDDDGEPLSLRRQSLLGGPSGASSSTASPSPSRSASGQQQPKKKAPTIDWFEFFLNAGCDIDDCTRYASSFERDKIDEALLSDITESTMRSLGLREGDIIRVRKAISERAPQAPAKDRATADTAQIQADEALAKQLQAQEQKRAPNLFTSPDGTLKNARRGRPQKSGTLPGSVDLNTVSTPPAGPARTGTPQQSSPIAASPVNPPSRTGSALATTAPASRFDDDAWTNRPASTKPLTPAPAAPARAPSAPPAPPVAVAPVAPAPPAPTPPATAPPRASSAAPAQQQRGLSQTTESDIFDQLARLSELRVRAPVAPTPPIATPPAAIAPAPAPAIVSPPPASYAAGLGAGPGTLSQHLQAQATGVLPPLSNGPRGPLAPVPANQALLQPLVPTQTGFRGFVPTSGAVSGLQPQPTGFQPSLAPQPTGFQPSLAPQPTAFQPQRTFSPAFQSSPSPSNFQPQPTGFQPSFAPQPTGFQPQHIGFQGGLVPQPTGFGSGFGAPSPPSSVPPGPPQLPQNQGRDTTPANVFAQMKAGTFGDDSVSAPQSADKYNALRTNREHLFQPTGWGFAGVPGGFNGYQG
ncbi:hypothetical protein K488DRAFT_50036 [Vararia minispora EC-137]|uniref:Uncharacterized protein n=1 Tax=Vararia minispora EC-137 TaxID=1314806 RepID=A0ACB8QLB6_9AGAM|nr:hypothetical protein K488DRAFT_50036 [Vararia minispora EC-137]